LVQRNLFENLVIAYEPVWAIGGKDPATPRECFEVVIALRRALASLVGIEHAKKVHIFTAEQSERKCKKLFGRRGSRRAFDWTRFARSWIVLRHHCFVQ
jgi:hypothetical protein